MGTQPQTWTVDDLVKAKDKSSTSEKDIEIPRFQRSLEWTDTQKMDLIAALIKGYPIGAPILYHDEEATKRNGKTTYLVVDGLQRITALAWYQGAQLERFSLDAIDTAEIEQFRAIVVKNSERSDLDTTEVDDELRNWLNDLKIVSDEFDGSALIDHMNSQLSCKVDGELKKACRSIVAAIRQLVNIDEITLPILVYSGNRRSLPSVFKDINTNGTQLSQYDILNAIWAAESTVVSTDKIEHAIEERYGLVEGAGFALEERDSGAYNLYEYLLGLGKYLLGGGVIPNLAFLASKRVRDDQADAIVFSITATTYGLRSDEMGDLPDHMERFDKKISPDAFQAALIDATNWVVECLRKYLDYDFKGSRGAVPHTVLQMASLISRVLVGKYSPRDWQVRTSWPSEAAVLQTNLPRYYLLDILKRNWSGSGDSRLFNVVWDTKNKPEDWRDRALSSHYLHPVTDDEIRAALQGYLDDSLREEDFDRKSASASDRLILKLAYRHKMTIGAIHEEFEIEHLMPVKLLQKLLKADPIRTGWPINSIGNLAALDKKTNREKSAKTIAAFVRDNSSERKRIAQYIFLDLDSVDYPYVDDPELSDWDNYLTFLHEDFNAMTEQIIDNLPGGRTS
ncbi:MAG: GmrSD restriction endonuclease domain-containing protein [Thermoleophilia bacterium]